MVAGGTSGLGLATARHLQTKGMHVVLLARSETTGHTAVAALGTSNVSFTAGDIASPTDVTAALDAAEQEGPLRIAVSCAGINRPGKTLGRHGPLPLPEFTELITTNLIGAFNLARLAAARMAMNDLSNGERGVILLTASAAAFEGQAGQAAYAASKAGVVGMTLPLARDLAAYQIRVVSIAPGLFDTPMLRSLPAGVQEALSGELLHPQSFGDPSLFAALVGHILDNPMLNGSTLRLDGAVRLPTQSHGPR
ncbi:SDR family NAD(P)-dependent oxidoreductase [Streptomyces sp. G1]|uniref:SDR family NAD(P)-dependent oxidoreductase n=1 Tax=Streptomyces sp. G1 TaxID=361572 RepID=UPI00202EBD98|nr:SDR family NAD(P)-dependent oxidoreductase [Streptomyces sp. G1]MCM1969442.1 SDR family NAD(P)-dependent oxidoreductase [Streptomyces sp. G1]